MTRTVRLRPWQKAALDRFSAAEDLDFLAVATPGAGKTTFALTAVRTELARRHRRVVVVAPTAHLKYQWARAAAGFSLHLDPDWSAASGALPSDMHGIVTTYQQVAANAGVLRRLAHDAVVVFDEIHHAGDEKAWGDSIRHAFETASRRLSLSGTPFRSDTSSIPFVRYELEEARPDFEYGYGDALTDGRVVRPVYFPRTDGHMEWAAPDGTLHSATFADPLDAVRANQRLRTALSLEGDWLPVVLRAAHERLTTIRRTDPSAGGLVIATDQDHARGIADQMGWRFGVRVTLATSDDPKASERISRFAASDDQWLVAVRMVSEGVDIPRLRVGVYATTTTTELFFRQAVGRLVRWTRGVPNQRSYLFIPDDARLRARAFQIADTRRHSLRRDTRPDAENPVPVEEEGGADLGADDGQLSLFSVISAVATEETEGGLDETAGVEAPEEDDGLDPTLLFELDALPAPPGAGEEGLTRREFKDRLRLANADAARELARITGWPHARVNAELNRLAGIRRITEATVTQLEDRLTHAERWRRHL